MLVTRWSRRDRLAVLVIGVAVAFLTGATVLLLAIGGQTAGIAAQFDTPGSATYVAGDAAPPDAGPDAQVLPVTTATTNRTTDPVTLVGVAPNTTVGEATLSGRPATTLGVLSAPRTERLQGPTGQAVQTVRPRRPAGVFPSDWYVTTPDTVRAVGPAGYLLVEPTAPPTTPEGVPLVGALAFFVFGTREAVGALGATAGGVGVLVGVTVYSISRMTVRDRVRTVQVIRATGAPTRDVVWLFTLRAALVSGVGIALGYVGGVIVAHASVTGAVAVGLPTSLSVGVNAAVLEVIAPLYAGLLMIGSVAGAVAAYPVARCPPARVQQVIGATTRSARLPDWLSPRILSWRALVPTIATLAAFVAFVILVAGLAGAVGPLLAADGATVTEPGSTHPVSSSVPAAYTDALEQRGIAASGEILLFQVVDGQPFVARGASYPAFANVTDATLTRGRPPMTDREAVIGADLARTLDVTPGETITLGGSTQPALTRLEIVGTFTAPGSFDDQLVVRLPTARHLAGVDATQVQFIRATRLPSTAEAPALDIGTPTVTGPAVANESLTVGTTVRNLGLQTATTTVTFRYRGVTRTRTVTVRATDTQQVTASFEAGPPGTYTAQVNNASTAVAVRPAAALSVTLPSKLPPASSPIVRVTDARGQPVVNATVTVAGELRRTDTAGQLRLPPLSTGSYAVTVRAGTRTLVTNVTVSASARKLAATTVSIRPATPTVLDRPVAQVTLANPWNTTLQRTVRVAGPQATRTQSVQLPPGATRTIDTRLSQRPPGQYAVAVRVDQRVVATTQYQVTGDDRVVAALASSGQTGTTGLGRAAAVAIGNLQVVLAALLGLAAAMTVGGATATFAQAVHARRDALGVYLATGATSWRVLRLIGRDTVLIGGVAALGATALGQAGLVVLADLGYLTVFGVRLAPILGSIEMAVTIGGGVLITLVGAVLATAILIRGSPAALLAPSTTPAQPAQTRGEADD